MDEKDEYRNAQDQARKDAVINERPYGPLPIGRRGAMGGETDNNVTGQSARTGGEGLTLDNIEDAFTYRPWNPIQEQQGACVREALVAAAKAILRHVPPCAARTLALNHLVDARMDANRAITWHGRF